MIRWMRNYNENPAHKRNAFVDSTTAQGWVSGTKSQMNGSLWGAILSCFEHLLNLHHEKLWYDRDLTVNWRTPRWNEEESQSVAMRTERSICPSCSMTLLAAYALPRISVCSPPALLVSTDKGGDFRGYSRAMLIEESRLFQVATFQTLHLHRSRPSAFSGKWSLRTRRICSSSKPRAASKRH